MDLEYELIVPELVLAGFATLVVALSITLRGVRQEVWGYLTALGLLVLLVLTAVFYINENDDFANVLAVDSYTVLFRVLFLGIALFAVVVGIQFAGDRLKHHGEFYGLIMFATLGMMLLAASRWPKHGSPLAAPALSTTRSRTRRSRPARPSPASAWASFPILRSATTRCWPR